MIEAAEKDQKPRYDLYFLEKSSSEDRFTFSKPSLPYNVERLRREGVDYVVLNRTEGAAGFYFQEELETNGRLVALFSPFKDPLRQTSLDTQALTGSPFLWRDLAARDHNGHIIEIYRLNSN